VPAHAGLSAVLFTTGEALEAGHRSGSRPNKRNEEPNAHAKKNQQKPLIFPAGADSTGRHAHI